MAGQMPKASSTPDTAGGAGVANPPSCASNPTRQPSSTSLSGPNRISEILDNARKRSVAIRESGVSSPMSISPRQSFQLNSDEIHPVEAGESSADEQTAIFRRDSGRRLDYQTTKNPLRSRNSQSTVRQSDEHATAVREAEEADEINHESWWKSQLAKYGSIELENKGSVARDHLALGEYATSCAIYDRIQC